MALNVICTRLCLSLVTSCFFADDLSTFCPLSVASGYRQGAAASHLLCLVCLPSVDTCCLLVDHPVSHRSCLVDFGFGLVGFVGLFGPTFWLWPCPEGSPVKNTDLHLTCTSTHLFFFFFFYNIQSQTRSCGEDQSLISSRCRGAVLQCSRCCVTSLSVSVAPTGGTPNLNYDLSGSDLRRLYSSPVFKAERMKRPLTGTSFVLGPLSHSGVRSVHMVTADLYILTGRGGVGWGCAGSGSKSCPQQKSFVSVSESSCRL